MMRFGFGSRLRHLRLQQILAIAAVGTAVALPVVLVSVGGGVSAHELGSLENAGYQIVVSAAGEHGITQAHNLTRSILRVGSVVAASPVLSIAVDVFPSGSGATPVLAEGVIPDEFTPTLGPAEDGLFPSPLPLGDPTDAVHFANGTYTGPSVQDVLVSSPLAQADGIQVGAELEIGPTAERGGAVAYNVTGTFGVPPTTLGPTGAFAIILPLSNLQVMSGFASGPNTTAPDAADTIEVAVAGSASTDPAALDQIQNAIQALVPYYSVSALDQEAAQLQSASGVLTGFYLALSSVGLTVGLLFLALVLVRRVESDRRSIGIQRALGLPGRWIARSIVGDGLLLASLGSLVGVVGGYAIVAGLATWGSGDVRLAARWAQFDPVTIGAIVLGVVLLSLLASGVATRSALRIEMTEALR
ncbi:MAG TPA: FtsX-like permease family protein [Thermoplasmata archaeon]|nr:FtsX-like permease family protein [Thermoplasmata archaeon]